MRASEAAGGDGIVDDSDSDSDGDDDGVDVVNLGCIPIDAIDQASDLGHLVRFHLPFVCRWIEVGGFICSGDLAIKTDSLSDAEYPDPDATGLLNELSGVIGCDHAADEPACANAAHIKLDSYDLVDLTLRDEEEADCVVRFVMRDIAGYSINGDCDIVCCIMDPGCSELLGHVAFGVTAKQFLIQLFHLVFHSGLDKFTEYFRGCYRPPDNETHAINLEEGRTRMELYAFPEKLDWPRIHELCRRHSDVDSVARLFKAWTELDYAEERARYPVEPWDGTPRWPMKDGKYLTSD